MHIEEEERDAWAEISSTLDRRFQTNQVTVGASTNPTLRNRFKKGGAMIELLHCQLGKHGLRPLQFNVRIFSLDVCGYSVGLGGQHSWNGHAAVEISRSSFRRFFF